MKVLSFLLLNIFLVTNFSYSQTKDQVQIKKEKRKKKKKKRSYKNMFEFSRNGVDLSHSSEQFEVSSAFQNNNVDHTTTTVRLNYARRVASNFWIQTLFNYQREEFEYDNNAGFQVNDKDTTTLNLQIAAMYNFGQNPTSAFYLKGGLIIEMNEENLSQFLANSTDLSVTGAVFGIGKRFSLKGLFGVPNMSYTVAASYHVSAGDYDITNSFQDSDVNISGFTINLLQVDLFF